MKTKITNIATVITWSSEKNKLVYYQDVEILIEDTTIIQIDRTVGDAEVEIDACDKNPPANISYKPNNELA